MGPTIGRLRYIARALCHLVNRGLSAQTVVDGEQKSHHVVGLVAEIVRDLCSESNIIGVHHY